MPSTALTPIVRHHRFGLLQPLCEGADLRKCRHRSSQRFRAACVLAPHLAADQGRPFAAGVYPQATCSGSCGAAGHFWQVIGVRAGGSAIGTPAGVESQGETSAPFVVRVTRR